jgi:hypothetical protein
MGLIKTGVKAAVFVKTAHVVHDRIERRQQAEWAAQGHPAPGPMAPTAMAPAGMAPTAMAPAGMAPTAMAPAGMAPTAMAPAGMTPAGPPLPAAVAAGDDMATMLAQLKQLGELRSAGVLTEAEFEAQKARILPG